MPAFFPAPRRARRAPWPRVALAVLRNPSRRRNACNPDAPGRVLRESADWNDPDPMKRSVPSPVFARGPYLHSSRCVNRAATGLGHGARHSAPTAPATPTAHLSLSRRLHAEAARADQIDTISMLFIAGCALVLVASCAVRVERCIAHWASFEQLVHAMLS